MALFLKGVAKGKGKGGKRNFGDDCGAGIADAESSTSEKNGEWRSLKGACRFWGRGAERVANSESRSVMALGRRKHKKERGSALRNRVI